MDSHTKQLEVEMTDAYDKYMDAIFRFCYLKINNREIAIDITQQTFLKTWEYLKKENKIDNIRALLYRIARNLIIDWYRKKKDTSLDLLLGNGIDFEDGIDTTTRSEINLIFEVLNKLDPPDKELILWRYYEEYTPKQIAAMIEESPNTVSVRISRAMKKIERILKDKSAN